jgi:toxin YoeB
MMRFLADLQHWIGNDPRMAARVMRIMIEIAREPREGIGKPERLKHVDASICSRRINGEHRLLYRYDDKHIEYLAARYHYEN